MPSARPRSRREGLGDHGDVDRHEARSTHALQQARRDEGGECGGRSAGGGAQAKQGQTNQEDGLSADHVRKSPQAQQQRRDDDQIANEHPFDAALERGPECVRDRGQPDVHDRGVEGGHEGRGRGERQDEPLVGALVRVGLRFGLAGALGLGFACPGLRDLRAQPAGHNDAELWRLVSSNTHRTLFPCRLIQRSCSPARAIRYLQHCTWPRGQPAAMGRSSISLSADTDALQTPSRPPGRPSGAADCAAQRRREVAGHELTAAAFYRPAGKTNACRGVLSARSS